MHIHLINLIIVASHEQDLTQLHAEYASDKIIQNLHAIKTHKEKDAKLCKIADQVFSELKYVPSHPTGVNC